jgi:hypothetical protein
MALYVLLRMCWKVESNYGRPDDDDAFNKRGSKVTTVITGQCQTQVPSIFKIVHYIAMMISAWFVMQTYRNI